MIEKTMPKPQITIGKRIGDMPPKASFTLISCPKHHRRQDGRHVRTEKIGAHAGNVAHVVAYVIGDGRGIANVVFGNARFDLADQIGSDVGRFCINAAADAREQRDRFGAEREIPSRPRSPFCTWFAPRSAKH